MAHDHDDDDSDVLDGCELDFAEDPTSDEDLPYVILFAGVQEEHGIFDKIKEHRHLKKRAEEWRELFPPIEPVDVDVEDPGWEIEEVEVETEDPGWTAEPVEVKS